MPPSDGPYDAVLHKLPCELRVFIYRLVVAKWHKAARLVQFKIRGFWARSGRLIGWRAGTYGPAAMVDLTRD